MIFQIVEKRKKLAREKASKFAEEQGDDDEENVLQPYIAIVPNTEVTKLIEVAESIIFEFSGKLQWIEGIYSPPTQTKGNTALDGERGNKILYFVVFLNHNVSLPLHSYDKL